MVNTAPIILADDDPDDLDFLITIIRELGITNEIRSFKNGRQLFDYLTHTDEQPFIVISDVNMPGMNGMEAKHGIDSHEASKMRAIPFVFLTNEDRIADISYAYSLDIQGYFRKEWQEEKLKETVRTIFAYWQLSKHP